MEEPLAAEKAGFKHLVRNCVVDAQEKQPLPGERQKMF